MLQSSSEKRREDAAIYLEQHESLDGVAEALRAVREGRIYQRWKKLGELQKPMWSGINSAAESDIIDELPKIMNIPLPVLMALCEGVSSEIRMDRLFSSALISEDKHIRWKALVILAYINVPRESLKQYATRMLDDVDSNVRKAATAILQNLKSSQDGYLSPASPGS